MHETSTALVERWWAEVFGLSLDQLWHSVTVDAAHGLLGGYPGWYVAWREAGVHVTVPSQAEADEVASLRAAPGPDLQEPEFWQAFAHQRGLVLRGPATHHYLDVDPGPAPGVREAGDDDLAALRASVSAEEWEESGWDDDPERRWVLVEDDRVVAAANLTLWAGAARDVGVLVHPDARGRGLSEVVGGHAASHAVRTHGLARWSARTTNVASVRAAERLGFEPYATQLGIRPE